MNNMHTAYILTFVKTNIIHHNNGITRYLRQQILINPGMKNIAIDIALESTEGYQRSFQ